MPPARSRTAAVALVSLLAGACGGAGAADEPTGGAGSAGAGLSAEVVQSRQDQVAGVVRVGLVNEGAGDVAASAVELVAPPFPPVTVDRSGRDPVVAGRRVDVRVPYGDPDCARGTEVTDAHVRVSTGEGEVSVPVDAAVLGRLLAQLCGERRVAEVAEVGFGTEWTRDGDDLLGSLVLRRREGAAERPAVALETTAPTVILDIEPSDGRGQPLATLGSGAEEAALPVRVGSPRCDPHALLESKKTYVFAAWVSLDGGEPLWLPVEAQGPAREAMGVLLAEVCDLQQ